LQELHVQSTDLKRGNGERSCPDHHADGPLESASRLSYFGGSLWQEKQGTTVTRQFTTHPMMPGPLAVHVSGESYLTLHDARQNLLAITDNTGAFQSRYRYEPFGTPSPTTSATGIEPRFGGLRWLNDTSLYLGGARMMDPRHGLWLSQDPLGYVDSLHLYAYAQQNPIDFADPSGLAAGKGGGSMNADGGIGMPTTTDGSGAATSKPSVFYGAVCLPDGCDIRRLNLCITSDKRKAKSQSCGGDDSVGHVRHNGTWNLP
jgi:RHS repeat-associated protein